MRARGFRPCRFTRLLGGDQQRRRRRPKSGSTPPRSGGRLRRAASATPSSPAWSRGAASRRSAKPPIGAISLSKRPSSMRVERAPVRSPARTLSISSRVMCHFSAIISADAELADLLIAVAREPARRRAERIGEAVVLAGQHRAGDRNQVEVLHAAGDDQILRAAHHALRGEVHGLLRGAALAIDGDARHVLAAGRPPASTCGRCRRPAARACRRSRT